eukprot:scaffold187_cov329-Pavlova_lutheri.AAC.16
MDQLHPVPTMGVLLSFTLDSHKINVHLVGVDRKRTILMEGNNIGIGGTWSPRLNLSERNGSEAHLRRALDFEP